MTERKSEIYYAISNEDYNLMKYQKLHHGYIQDSFKKNPRRKELRDRRTKEVRRDQRRKELRGQRRKKLRDQRRKEARDQRRKEVRDQRRKDLRDQRLQSALTLSLSVH